ncbi:universal stress protein [Nitratireductor rhodophyticola]|uniref:universal stress protein n=1 Tax=Nitratireductor rhodophyticola TaxID=2854036 RepID=UPI00081416DC|nr:universal stress protein [Nitratireductor rhodophyticola]MEC9247012.1 universal stress protein [Pseudomonadota bacterium]WPZ15206.1 universal stress protein [Nitratireductor rhodophyticola]
MFKKILVPVDGSENSLKALEMGVKMQKTTGAEILMLTVFRHHSLLEASMSMVRPDDPQNLDDAMREHAKEIADAAKKAAVEMGAESPRAFVKNGQPARTIVKFAKEREVDLIVLGSRGLGDLEGYLLGSVSHKVTSLANCPVMVV